MLIPDELAPTYSLDTRSELPSSRLRLDWVYPLITLPLCPLGREVPVRDFLEAGPWGEATAGISQATVEEAVVVRASGGRRSESRGTQSSRNDL
ncbi:echinoderm microtubule-associated protein-like 2 isoform 1, partial [Cricetulus griseus]